MKLDYDETGWATNRLNVTADFGSEEDQLIFSGSIDTSNKSSLSKNFEP